MFALVQPISHISQMSDFDNSLAQTGKSHTTWERIFSSAGLTGFTPGHSTTFYILQLSPNVPP